MSSYFLARAGAAWTSASGRTDTLLLHLTRVLSTPSGVDTTLITLCYTLTLLHSQLRFALGKQYERLAAQIAEKASDVLYPGETVVATIEPPITYLSQTTAGTKALADLIGDFRIFVRLWGLLGVYTWAKSTYATPPRDAIIKSIVWTQVVVSGFYQFLENGAYLTSKGVLRGDKWTRREDRWWVWSNRFWCAQVSLEFLRLLRVRQLKFNEDFGAQSEDAKEVKIQSKELEQRWWRDLYVNAAWFPQTVHWSTEDGCVPEHWIGVCGTVAGVIGFKERWQETA